MNRPRTLTRTLIRLAIALACLLAIGGCSADDIIRTNKYTFRRIPKTVCSPSASGAMYGDEMYDEEEVWVEEEIEPDFDSDAVVPDSPRTGGQAPAERDGKAKEPDKAKAAGEGEKSSSKVSVKPPGKGGGVGFTRPVAADKSSVGKTGVKTVFQDLSCEMMAVLAEDFEKPQNEVPMSLLQVTASVLRNNREIRVAAHKPDQARAGIMEAKSVYDPEAFADWTHTRTDSPQQISISGVPSRNREYRNEVGRAGVRQHMPSGGTVSVYREWNSGIERNPGVSRTAGHGGAYVAEVTQPILNGFADMENRTVITVSRLQADMSEEEFRQKVMEIMAQAMESYWNVVLAREDIRINQESLTMAENLLEREMGRKDEGISTQLDVNRAREAVATRAYNLMLSRETHTAAQESLKYLLNDRSAPIGMDVYVEPIEQLETPLLRPNIDKSIDTALENRPEMKNAELAIQTSEARRRYARHTLLPEVNLTGSLRHNDKESSTPTTGSSSTYTGTDWSVGVGLSMPIGNMKARANVRMAESEVAQTSEDKKNARDLIITEVRTVIKSMELVVREIPLNRRALDAAVKVLEGEWAKLELNQTGNRDLLQAQDLTSVAERNYVQSLTRYNIHIIKLLAAEGTLLEKMGIRVSSESM